MPQRNQDPINLFTLRLNPDFVGYLRKKHQEIKLDLVEKEQREGVNRFSLYPERLLVASLGAIILADRASRPFEKAKQLSLALFYGFLALYGTIFIMVLEKTGTEIPRLDQPYLRFS